MIRFGPSGNSESFYAQGYKHTYQAMEWLENMGLNAYEYSFGRGVNLSDESAALIAKYAAAHHIKISVHAPYFINLANPDPEKREHSYDYILSSAHAADILGGDRVVVHVGAEMKMQRDEALRLCREGLKEALLRLKDAGLSHVHICPETMGKYSQIGNLEETLDFCLLDESLIPTIDFAHLNALLQGKLDTGEAFERVLDKIESALGQERARRIHVHFSTIEFTDKGEKRHRTFAEADFGPRFEHLAPLLVQRAYTPTVICESKGTMAEDALSMKKSYDACL